MLRVFDQKKRLYIEYEPRNSIGWILDKFDSDGLVTIKKAFTISNEDVLEFDNLSHDSASISFEIGKLVGDYWEIYSQVLEIQNPIHIHKSFKIKAETFLPSKGISTFFEISKITKEPIWIGGDKQGSIPSEVFSAIILRFPNSYEIENYSLARVSSVLKEYYNDSIDFEAKYEKYREKKRQNLLKEIGKNRNHGLSEIFKDVEKNKYIEILKLLKSMLSSIDDYTEKQWQDSIIDIVLLIYPKYICVIDNVKIKDMYSKKDRFLDYLLIDANGNTDIIEIKKPFTDCLVTKGTYRDNYVPMRELSGSIMQIEKYIFNMNKWGIYGEAELTKKYKSRLPDGVEIKIINPKGIVIMGRSNELLPEQKDDFEIIKRKYNHVTDILSYDDLIERIERIVKKYTDG